MAKPREEQLGAITVLDEDSSGTVDCNSAKLTNMATPTLPTDGANKAYVDSRVSTIDTLTEVLANGNTTDGEHISVNDGYVEFGTAPAGTGDIRLSANGEIYSVDSGGADTAIIALTGNTLVVGDDVNPDSIVNRTGTGSHYWVTGGVTQGALGADGLLVSPAGAAGADNGTIRLPGDASIVARGHLNLDTDDPDGYVYIKRDGTEIAVFDSGGSNRLKLAGDDAVLEIGDTAPDIGAIRIPNNTFIYTGIKDSYNHRLLGEDDSGNLIIGFGGAVANVYSNQIYLLDGSGGDIQISTSSGIFWDESAAGIEITIDDKTSGNGSSISFNGQDSADGDGGGVFVSGGSGGPAGAGGSLTLSSGSGGTTSSGDLSIATPGNDTFNIASGSIDITTGSMTHPGSLGTGDITIQTGTGVNAASGDIFIYGGQALSGGGTGGSITIESQDGGSGGAGTITLKTGENYAAVPGDISIEAGPSGTNGPGNISLTAGNATASILGGNISLTAGDSSGATGGDVSITAGHGFDNGGDVILNSGTGDNGYDGYVIVQSDSVEVARFGTGSPVFVDFTLGTTEWSFTQTGALITGLDGSGYNIKADNYVKFGTIDNIGGAAAVLLESGTNSAGATAQVLVRSGAGTDATGATWLYTGDSSADVSGSIKINSGTAGGGNSGEIDINTGTSSTASSGEITLESNAGYSGTGRIRLITGGVTNSGNTGDIDIQTGNNTNTGNTGSLNFGAGDATVGAGGSARFDAGNGSTGGGDITMYAGTSSVSGTGGSVSINGGSHNGVGNGGSITLNTGTAAGGRGGQFTVSCGNGTTGYSYINMTAGGASAGDGSNATMSAGVSTGGGVGGTATINGGNSNNSSGGNVVLDSGGGITFDGYVIVKSDSTEVARFGAYASLHHMLFAYEDGVNNIIDVNVATSGDDGTDLILKGGSVDYGAGGTPGDLVLRAGEDGTKGGDGEILLEHLNSRAPDVWYKTAAFERGSLTFGHLASPVTEVVISVDAPTTDLAGLDLSISAAAGNGTGVRDGGDLNLNGGAAADTGTGGEVNITAGANGGTSGSDGGSVNIYATDGNGGAGGSVLIGAGGGNTYGSIQLEIDGDQYYDFTRSGVVIANASSVPSVPGSGGTVYVGSGILYYTGSESSAMLSPKVGTTTSITTGAGYVEIQETAVALTVKNTSRRVVFDIDHNEDLDGYATGAGSLEVVVGWLNNDTQIIQSLITGLSDSGATPSLTGSLVTGVDWQITLNADHTVALDIAQDAATERSATSRYWFREIVTQVDP